MPNYDLGTAHGRIRIDADTRNVKAAETSVDSFRRTLNRLSVNAIGTNAALDRIERQLRQVTREYNRADRAANDFSGVHLAMTARIGDGVQRFQQLRTTVQQIADTMRRGQHTWTTYGVPVVKLTQGVREFSKHKNSLLGMGAALQKIGVLSLGLTLVKNRFLGIGAALAGLSLWQRKLLTFSATMGTMVAATRFLSRFPSIAGAVTKAFAAFTTHTGIVGRGLNNLVGHVGRFRGALERIPQSISQTMIGFAVMKRGLAGLMGPLGLLIRLPGAKLAWMAVIGPGLLSIASVAQATGKVLTWFSNTLLGLWDGIKQLSGGVLVLPAVFTTLAASLVPVIGIFTTLKSSLKDVFKAIGENDPTKLATAMASLPAYLRPLAQTLATIIPQFRGLGAAFTSAFIQGLPEQLKALTTTYLPALSAGGLAVTRAWKNARDELVAFLLQKQQVDDLKTVFSFTANIINNLGAAFPSLIAGLRDLTIPGAKWLAIMSGHAKTLTDRFAQWAEVNRQNGRIFYWIDQAWKGIKDLTVGMGNLTKALWTVLTMFKTDTGESFLARFRQDMAQFNAAVQKSAAEGLIKRIGDAIRSMKSDKLKLLGDDLRRVGQVIGQQIIPLIMQFNVALNQLWGYGFRSAIWVIEQFLTVLKKLGAGAFLGWFVAIASSFKMMMWALAPIRSTVLAVWGAFQMWHGLQGLIAGFGGALAGLGGRFASLGRLVTSSRATIAAWGNTIALVLLIAGAAFVSFKQYEANVKNFNRSLDDSKQHLNDFKENLKEAFKNDNGLVGDSVISAIRSQLNTLIADMQNTADNAPSLMDRLTDAVKTSLDRMVHGDWNQKIFGAFGGESDAFNKWQDDVRKSGSVVKKLQELRDQGVDLVAIITSSDEVFQVFIDNLRTQGDEGKLTADKLQELHDIYKKIKADNTGIGTQLTSDLQDTGEAASEATTSSEALALSEDDLKNAIEGTDDAYQKFLKDLADKKAPQQLIDTVKQLREQWMHGGKQVHDFADAIKEFSDNTQDADSRAQKFIKSLQAIGGLPDDSALAKYNEDVENAIGWQSDMVDMLDKTGNQLVQNNGRIIQNSQNGRKLSQTITQLTQDAVALVAAGAATPEEAYAYTTDVLNKLLQEKYGISPDVAAQVIQTYFPQNIFQDALKKASEGADPKDILRDIFKGKPAELDTAIKLLDTPESIIAQLVGPDGKLHIQAQIDASTPGQQPPGQQPGGIIFPEPENRPQVLYPPGQVPAGTGPYPPAPATPAPITNVNDPRVDTFFSKYKNDEAGFRSLLAAHPDIQAILQPYIDNALSQGKSFSQAFAEGIAAGSPEVVDAILKLAQLAAGGLGSSPAKYGPLSGTGWTFYRGQQFTQSWAQGIVDNANVVEGAVTRVAGFAVKPLDRTQEYFKQLKDLVAVGEHWFNIGDRIKQIVLDVAKLANTLSFGKLFPKTYTRDTSKDLRRGNPLPPPNFTPRQPGFNAGNVAAYAPAQIPANATREQVVSAIVAEGRRRGLSDDEIAGVLAVAQQESNFGEMGFMGFYGNTPGANNYNTALQKFFDNYMAGGYGQGGGAAAKNAALQALAQGNPEPFLNWLQYGVQGARPEESPLNQSFAPNVRKFFGQWRGNLPATPNANAINVSNVRLPPGVLRNEPGYTTQPIAQNAAAIIASLWPQITNIGGGGPRPNARGTHDVGLSIDINIPNWNTPEGVALGNQINEFLKQNSQQLGIVYTIWQNQGWESGARAQRGTTWPQGGHMDHIDINFVRGANINNVGDGGVRLLGNNGQWNPLGDAALQGLTPPGRQGGPGGTWGQGHLTPGFSTPGPGNDLQNNTNALNDNTNALNDNSAALPDALQPYADLLKTPLSQDEAVTQLQSIDAEIERQNQIGGPQAKAISDALGQKRGQIMEAFGLKEGPSMLETIESVVNGATSIVSDVFGLIGAGIEALDATKNIADTLVRGVANTEDVFNMVDQVQKYIEFAAKIAGTVADVASTVGSLIPSAGGADFGGTEGAKTALQAVAAIAGAVAAGLETLNAAIDIGQEIYRIAGSYVGPFLQSLAGGGAAFQGNVKFLLDTNSGRLLAYSAENPQLKVEHFVPGMVPQAGAGQQTVGQLNYYAGPGQDPRDSTRQMLYQIQASQMAVAVGQ